MRLVSRIVSGFGDERMFVTVPREGERMNPLCECPVAGWCKRHQINKDETMHALCSGQRGQPGWKYFAAWEAGRLGATAPANANRNPPLFEDGVPGGVVGCGGCGGGVVATVAQRARTLAAAAVDFVKDGMAIATVEQQAHRLKICEACPIETDGWCDGARGGCGCNLELKVKARAAYCPQYKWSAYTDNYRPLSKPTRSLIFHLYPKTGAEWNWHWHIEQIRVHQAKFNGQIVIGVGTDKNTATFTDVKRLCDGIRVDQWIHAENSPALAETHTHVALMREVMTDDPNSIVFRYHTKGVTKTPDSVEQKWARLLWQVNMDLPSVEDALAGHLTCGAMRSLKPLVQKPGGNFFFAGSAYWFRAKEAFERDWTAADESRWWVEFVPAHLFAKHESACLLHDLTESSVIRPDHFAKYIQPEWDQWKAARGLA